MGTVAAVVPAAVVAAAVVAVVAAVAVAGCRGRGGGRWTVSAAKCGCDVWWY